MVYFHIENSHFFFSFSFGNQTYDYSAYDRPKHKLRIIKTLQREGEVVAMTGKLFNLSFVMHTNKLRCINLEINFVSFASA